MATSITIAAAGLLGNRPRPHSRESLILALHCPPFECCLGCGTPPCSLTCVAYLQHSGEGDKRKILLSATATEKQEGLHAQTILSLAECAAAGIVAVFEMCRQRMGTAAAFESAGLFHLPSAAQRPCSSAASRSGSSPSTQPSTKALSSA